MSTTHTPGPWELVRYQRSWAIFDRISRCYVLFGSKKRLEKRLKELNYEE